jgi:hypothetical protein
MQITNTNITILMFIRAFGGSNWAQSGLAARLNHNDTFYVRSTTSFNTNQLMQVMRNGGGEITMNTTGALNSFVSIPAGRPLKLIAPSMRDDAVECCPEPTALRYRAIYNCLTGEWEMYGEPETVEEPDSTSDHNRWLQWEGVRPPAWGGGMGGSGGVDGDDCGAMYYQVPPDEDNPPTPAAPPGWTRRDCCGECTPGMAPMPLDPTRLYCIHQSVNFTVNSFPHTTFPQQRFCMEGWVFGNVMCVGCEGTISGGRSVVLNAVRVTGNCDFWGQWCGPTDWVIDYCHGA